MIRSAQVSECGHFRYRLDRHWHRGYGNVCWVMLNPSTADASVDDATIRKCIGFTKRWGAGGIVVVNLWPWRATDPKDLKRLVASPPVPWFPFKNAGAIREAVEGSDEVVVAWGAHANRVNPDWTSHIAWKLRSMCRPMCLGVTKDDSPRHPLMLAYSTPLRPFDEEAA